MGTSEDSLSNLFTPSYRKELMMLSIIHRLAHDEEGATMVEYGLLVALIAMVALVGVTTLGTNLQTLFTSVAGSV
jgi:pilus assembly protein Flp/PilA